MSKTSTKPLAPADSDIVLPKAVRDAAARAEALQAQVYAPQPEAGTEQQTEQPTEQQPVEQQMEMFPAAPGGTQPNENVPTPAAHEAPAAGDAGAGTEQNWEHMYKSTKGRLDRAQLQIDDLTSRLGDMQRVVASMTTTPASPETPAPAPQRLITPQEESDYGQEFLGVVAKKAREELSGEFASLDRRFQDLERRVQTVNNVTTLTARQRMEQTLDSQIPEWRNINIDPQFLVWLRLPDTFSGVIRHELLMRAYENNETSRVAAFFNGFLAEEAAVAPQSGRPDQQPGVTTEGKVPLETFAAPGRARTAAAPPSAPAEKPVITRKFVTQFYVDVAAGKYRGRDEERDRTERAIFDAGNEGRIQ